MKPPAVAESEGNVKLVLGGLPLKATCNPQSLKSGMSLTTYNSMALGVPPDRGPSMTPVMIMSGNSSPQTPATVVVDDPAVVVVDDPAVVVVGDPAEVVVDDPAAVVVDAVEAFA